MYYFLSLIHIFGAPDGYIINIPSQSLLNKSFWDFLQPLRFAHPTAILRQSS